MKNEKACSGEGTAQTMPKAGAAQAAAKTGAGRTGPRCPDCPCPAQEHTAQHRAAGGYAEAAEPGHRAAERREAMIEDNRYCGDVLTQLAAAESAVRRVSEMVLAEHMRTCVVEEVRAGNDEVIDEVMALMRRFSK